MHNCCVDGVSSSIVVGDTRSFSLKIISQLLYYYLYDGNHFMKTICFFHFMKTIYFFH